MAFDLSSFRLRYKDLLTASCAASKSGNGFEERSIGNGIISIAFSGSLSGTAFSQASTKFGECAINENNNYFGSLVDWSAANDKTQQALVHREALNKFLQIWPNSDLEKKVERALETRKTVLFTGHSIGGAIATLATLLILEKKGKDALVFAITFGFPLIGDEVLARAVRRHGWANHFFNIVSRSDIFARTLLAPCPSVCTPLEALLPHWQRSVEQMDGDDEIMEEAPPADLDFPEYLRTVLRHACTVVNFITVANMEPTNKLTASLKPAVKLSPYRPFGCHLFCSDKGTLCVENNEAVLPILFYSLVTAKDQASISDHTGYGKVFQANTGIVYLEGLPNLPLSQGAPSSAMEIQLDALGLGIENTRARLALRAAGEHENKLKQNWAELLEEQKKLEGSGHMKNLKAYRSKCLNYKNISYYDAFKAHREEEDFQANLNRLNLAAFYDKLEEMVDNHQLPDDFQCNEELVRKWREYLLLVEPLDIANYHRLGKHEESGHYYRLGKPTESRRPRRFKALEKWSKDMLPNANNAGPPEITKDSRFWAIVEALSNLMSNPRENQQVVRAEVNEFQNYVKQMMDSNELCVEEVVKGESSFVKWWRKLSPQDQQASPIASIFVGRN